MPNARNAPASRQVAMDARTKPSFVCTTPAPNSTADAQTKRRLTTITT